LISKISNIEIRRNHLLYVVSAATFLVFFQAFMVAPLIPKLAHIFHVSPAAIGLIIPAYLLPYGISTLFYGPLSDHFGRKPILTFCFIGFILLSALTAISRTLPQILVFRVLTGLFAGGIIPITLALISDLFDYAERGRAIGWLFGAMAGGMAFGSTFGAMLEPLLTWSNLFVGAAILICGAFLYLLTFADLLGRNETAIQHPAPRFGKVLLDYGRLLQSERGIRTYAYVLLNGLLHSGVYTWLGYLFVQYYGLNEFAIGLALLGYGVPGFLFGPALGKLADRYGRRYIIPIGLVIAGISSIVLGIHTPIIVAAIMVTVLSLGYDMTQPLLAGIVTDLSPNKGLAIGLMAFVLFLGFGTGSYVFSAIMQRGLSVAFTSFGILGLALALFGFSLYRDEKAGA
jgi:predicted MFS family arabinose efflux permease